jgi:hypothetical protein
MALGIGNSGGYRTHTIDFFGEGGAVVTVWLDDIRKIQDATEDDALVIFRDGTERRLEWTCNGCQRDPMMRSAYLRTLFFANPQDADEKVDLAKVKSVEFLAPARKDKEGHAMFDNWHFSPFTGEKLPEK